MKTAIWFIIVAVLVATAEIWGKGLVAIVLYLGDLGHALGVLIPVAVLAIIVTIVIIIVIRARRANKRIRSFKPKPAIRRKLEL